MVEGLPPDGALARTTAGHHWQHRDFMLADLLDEMARLRTDFGNAHRDEKKAAPRPYPDLVWRPEKPGAKKKRKKKARQEAAEARSGYMRIVALATPQYAEKG